MASLSGLGPLAVFVVLPRPRVYCQRHETSEYSVRGVVLPVLGIADASYLSDLAFTSFKRQILHDAPTVDSLRATVVAWLNKERAERSAFPPLDRLHAR